MNSVRETLRARSWSSVAIAAIAVVFVGLCIGSVAHLWNLRSVTVRYAEAHLDGIAQELGSEFRDSVFRIENWNEVLRRRVLLLALKGFSRQNEASFSGFLIDLVDQNPELEGVVVTDRNGKVLYASNGPPGRFHADMLLSPPAFAGDLTYAAGLTLGTIGTLRGRRLFSFWVPLYLGPDSSPGYAVFKLSEDWLAHSFRALTFDDRFNAWPVARSGNTVSLITRLNGGAYRQLSGAAAESLLRNSEAIGRLHRDVEVSGLAGFSSIRIAADLDAVLSDDWKPQAEALSIVIALFLLGSGVLIVLLQRLRKAHRRSEVRLHQQSVQNATVLESAVDGFALIDAQGTIRQVNASLLRLFGFDSETELIGKNVSLLMNSRDAELHDGYLKRYMGGGAPRVVGIGREVLGKRKDGTLLPLRLSVSETVIEGQKIFAGFIHDLTGEKEAEARIQRLAFYDELTGLRNATSFLRFLEDAGSVMPDGPGNQLTLLQFAIDDYNETSGTFGSEVASAIVEGVAKTLVDGFPQAEFIARTGADRFVLVLPDMADCSAERIRNLADSMAETPIAIGGSAFPVSLSVGAMVFPSDEADPAKAFNILEVLTDQACSRGVRQTSLCSVNSVATMRNQTELLIKARHALDHSEFRLFVQPQVRISDGSIRGTESLIRWPRPEGGWLSPAEFIPTVERTDLIERISDWMLGETLAFNRGWLARHGSYLRTGVNISAREFALPGFVEKVTAIVDDGGVPRNFVELEITETVIMDDWEASAEKLRELIALGFEVALDDFGVGYSSLSQMLNIPASRLKIDRSFITDIDAHENKREVVKFIVELAHNLKMPVIAEGIENVRESAVLAGLSCDEAQGYLYHRPVDAQVFLQSDWVKY